MKRLMTAAVLSLACIGVAGAAPLVPKHIAADARWFAHVDLDALRAVKPFKLYVDNLFQGRRQILLEEMFKLMGMDPREDLTGITLYATDYDEQSSVGLFYVRSVDQQKLIAFIKRRYPDYKTAPCGARTLYCWPLAHRWGVTNFVGTFASESLMLIGRNPEHVSAALEVIDGKKAGLASDAELLKDLAPGAFFASRALGVPESFRKRTGCPILRDCTAASFQCSLAQSKLTARCRMTAESAETARQFQQIVEGFQALGDLRYQDMPAVLKVTRGLKYALDKEAFSLTWTASVDDVQAGIQAVLQRRHAEEDRGR